MRTIPEANSIPVANYKVIRAIENGEQIFSDKVIEEIVQAAKLPLPKSKIAFDLGEHKGGIKNISSAEYLFEMLNYIAERWRVIVFVDSPGHSVSKGFKYFEKVEIYLRLLSELIGEMKLREDGSFDKKEEVKFGCQRALEEFPSYGFYWGSKFQSEHEKEFENIMPANLPMNEVREKIDELNRRALLLKENFKPLKKMGHGGPRRGKDITLRLLIHMVICVYENAFARKAATSTNPDKMGQAGGPLIRFSTEILSRLGYEDIDSDTVRSRLRAIMISPPEPLDYLMVSSRPIPT